MNDPKHVPIWVNLAKQLATHGVPVLPINGMEARPILVVGVPEPANDEQPEPEPTRA